MKKILKNQLSIRMLPSLIDIKAKIKTSIKIVLLLNVICFCNITNRTWAQNVQIKKSLVLFTQASAENDANYQRFKADGLFWGFMNGNSITNNSDLTQYVNHVTTNRSRGRVHFGRGEFDWGWKWYIDYMGADVDNYWSKNFDLNNIYWGSNQYKGVRHSWQSHHGPKFEGFLKFQFDKLNLANISHVFFDSQTSGTRTLQWYGGDYSVHSMNGFREYLKQKYTPQELTNLGITNINTFNYRQFLLNKGFTQNTIKSRGGSIEGNIPLYKDFVYFQRDALNKKMETLFDHINTLRPGIPIGATTNLIEPRGYIFSDKLTYLAGEFGMPSDVATSPSTEHVLHYKAAEATNKTLIYFPYPDAFKDLQQRNAPRQSRAWIAQAYAMGSIFTIPGKVWTNSTPSLWDMGWQNHVDLYTFVKDHSQLFDDYKAVSNVALGYSVYASLLHSGMSGSQTTRATVDALVKANISFDFKIFGDPDRPITPTNQELAPYDVVALDADKQYFTTDQNQLITQNNAKVVTINNPTNLTGITSRLSWKLDVLQNGTVRNDIISVLPRASTKDASAPYVLHLINRKYDPTKDNATTHNNIVIKVPTSMLPNRILSAKLHKLDKTTVNLPLNTNTPGHILLNIGTFKDCWAMIELVHGSGNNNPDPTTQLIANGEYTIESTSSNQRLLSRAVENHNAIMHDPLVYNDQKWIFTHLGDNIYTIKNKGTNRFLEVPYAKCENFVQVATYTQAFQDHQKWKVVENGNGIYGLQPAHCVTQALDRNNGTLNTNVHTYSYWSGNTNQKWKIITANTTARVINTHSSTIDSNINIYPNPAKDFMIISGVQNIESVSVVDLSGRKITIEKQKIENGISLNISNLQSGTYIAVIENEKQPVSLKFIKE
jgi:hypothetical protein